MNDHHVSRYAILGKKTPWLLLVLCIVVGTILRLGRFPNGDSPTEMDEVGYLSDGLLLLEGETSIHKYAPSGPLTWLTGLYAGGRAVLVLLSGGKDLSGFPGLLRPVAAMENSLFQLYADMSTLRLVAVTLMMLLCLASVAAAYRLGHAFMGPIGGLASGLMVASLPPFVELSSETRPYAIAWAFAVMALAAAGSGRPHTRVASAGIFFGLAVGSHIDILRLAPLLLLLLWRRAEGGAVPWRDFWKITVISAISFLLVAPWYLLHLIDNIRQIITVRLLVPPLPFWREWFAAGIAIPLAITLAGLLLAGLRRRWPEFCCGIWLALNTALATRPSAHGLHHDGALLVMIAVLLPLGLSVLADVVAPLRTPAFAWALLALIIAPTVWRGARVAFVEGRSLDPDQAVAWVEKNVAPGAQVFIESSGTVSLLPTAQAANRLWSDVTAPDAWIAKYQYDTARFGLGGLRPLRVMSSDRIVSDRGNRRRYYILGAPLQPERPRYDLWIVSGGSFYDLKPTDVIERLCHEGGVYIHSGSTAVEDLPPPAVTWSRADGNSTYIYQISVNGCAEK